jgi:hypothetical protein
MTAVLFPDAVDLVLTHIDSDITVPVLPRVPTDRPASFVTVRRVGGTRRTIVSDDALLSFEAWAATDQAAADLVQLVRQSLHEMKGTVVSTTAIYQVTEASGPALFPDPESLTPRYVFTASVHLRGA